MDQLLLLMPLKLLMVVTKLVRDHLNLDLYPHLALLFRRLPLRLVVSGQLE